MPRYGPVWLGALLVALLAAGCLGGALTLPASEPVSTLPTAFPDSPVQLTGDASETCERALKDEAWSTAVAACERARDAAPGSATASGRLSKAYLGRGRSVLSVGRVEEALRWFERAREAQPDSSEATREYALAAAYRAAEAALAAGDRVEALAKFRAVYDGDRLYLAWLPERSARHRLAEIETQWGHELAEEGVWGEAEAHCRAALDLVPTLESAQECIGVIFRARTPTPTPSPTPVPTRIPVQRVPVVPNRPVAPPPPPRPAATSVPPTRVAPAIPTLGVPVGRP